MIKMSEEEIRVEDENRAELRDGQPGDIPSPQKKIIDYALGNVKNRKTLKCSKAYLTDNRVGLRNLSQGVHKNGP